MTLNLVVLVGIKVNIPIDIISPVAVIFLHLVAPLRGHSCLCRFCKKFFFLFNLGWQSLLIDLLYLNIESLVEGCVFHNFLHYVELLLISNDLSDQAPSYLFNDTSNQICCCFKGRILSYDLNLIFFYRLSYAVGKRDLLKYIFFFINILLQLLVNRDYLHFYFLG